MLRTQSVLLIALFIKGAYPYKEYFHIDDSFAGTTCLDLVGHRKFEMSAPSLVACMFACRANSSCMGASYHSLTGQCIGCKCQTMRPDTDRLPLVDAVFVVRPPATLFEGKCGSIADDGITAEYHLAPGGSYTTSTAPSVRVDTPVIWRPDRNESYFLKVDFADGPRLIHGVGIQGWLEGSTLEYVTQFSVFNSPDCVTKQFVDSLGISRQLDSPTTKYHKYLDSPLHTQCVFIRVDEWVHYPSIRFELKGY